jgi:signal transduction histidine kinase
MSDVECFGARGCISHCLKTPLQRVLSFIEMYKMGALGTPTQLGLESASQAEEAIWNADGFVKLILNNLDEDYISAPGANQFHLKLSDAELQKHYEQSISKPHENK